MLTPEMVWRGDIKRGDKLKHKSGEVFIADDFMDKGVHATDMYVLFDKRKFYLLSECELCD